MDWGMKREYLISDPKILAPGFRQREMSNEQIFFCSPDMAKTCGTPPPADFEQGLSGKIFKKKTLAAFADRIILRLQSQMCHVPLEAGQYTGRK